MDRTKTVVSLVKFDRPLNEILRDLEQFDWDWMGPPLARVTIETIATILVRHRVGELADGDVEAWANMIECRDDIESDAAATKAIFDLANPSLQGPLEDVAKALLKSF